MRPLRKYPNGGDIKDSGELPQINLTASRANWEKQKELRKQLAQTQQDYNNLINDYGLKADDQAQFGFQDYQGGMSSTEELQAKINKLNESYKNVQDQFASANRALADLRTAYPDEWNNKTVSDVISDSGLRAMQRLNREEKINNLTYKDFYSNYGSLIDPNIQRGYGPGATYSAEKTRKNWMEDPTDFINMVNKGVQYGLGLAGAGATGLASRAAGATSLIGKAAPYATAPLTIGSKTFPLINPINTIGLGFGAHSAANLVDPNSASRQSISRAYQNPTTENILDATGNVTMDALGVLTSPGMGNMLLKAGQGIANTPRAIGNLYEDVATGNSLLTDFGVPAWKLEKPIISPKSSDYIVKNYTDDQIKLLDKYGKGMKDLTPEEWQQLEELRKSGVTDFSQGNFPISRVIGYYAPNSAENTAIQNLKRGEIFNTPTDKSIRTWSAGIPKTGPHFKGKTRLVIPRRYTKNLGSEFAGMPYYDKRSQFIWDPKFGLNKNAVTEKELIGNVPNGFKVIGKVKQDGLDNIIIKPINAENTGLNNLSNYLTTQTPLQNLYKINPFAGKLGKYNRIVGPNAMQDLQESGLVRAGDYGGSSIPGQPSWMGKRTTPYPSFGKGIPTSDNVYAQKIINEGKIPYIISTDRAMKASTLGRHGRGSTQFPVDDAGKYMTGFPANEAKLFEFGDPHWLKGYKEIPKELPGSSSVTPYKVTPYSTTNSSIKDVYEKLKKSRDFIKTEGEKELADFASEEGLKRARLAFKKTNPKLTDDEIDSLVADQMTELQNAINYNLPEYALKNPDIWKNFNTDNTSKFWLETNFPNNNAFAWDNPSFYEEMTNLEGIPTYSNPNLINMDTSELGSFKGLPTSMQKSLLDSQLDFTRPYFRIPTISIGPKHIGNVPTMAHEVGHLLQRSGLHPTDLELQKLVNKEGITPSALIQKTWNQLFRLSPQYNNSFKYFYAPKGRVIPDEGYAFARETRQTMLDKGIIKDKFEEITPLKILQYRLSQPFSMQGGQRLTTIVPPWKWKGLSKIMNDMNVVIPGAVGTGAAGYGLSNSQNNNSTYKSGGNLAPNISTYYNFKGTPIYRDTTALPFASGGMLDGPPDNPVLPSLKNLNTNEVSALLYNTVANIIERKKAEGKIKPGENLDLRGVVAQILLESGNAKSGLTAKYNNFGGLKATQGFIDRGGKTVSMVNKATGKKFLWRAYDTPEQGLEAQIDFLLDNPRYRKAGVFNAKNTQEYLAAVSKAGYAGGEPTYARKVNQMARSLDKRLKKVTPEKLQELNQTYNVSPTLQPIGVNTAAPITQAAVTPQVQAPVIDPAILAMRENLAIPAKSSIDLLKAPISQLEEMPPMGPELNPPSFVPDEGYYMSGLPTPEFRSRVVPFMGKGASNYQTSGGLRLPYVSGWNQNQFINPIAKRVQQQTGYDPDYYYGTDETPGEYEKASLENRPINFEGGFASKKMQRDAEQYLQEYDQYNQLLQDSENYGNLMLGRQFKYGSNLYERQGLIPSMYASSLGRYYGNGGKFITAGGEYHRVYKNAEGDIIVNHPKEDKGQWDTINLTDKANAKTIAQGVAATKKWHRENPNTYSNGGKIDYSMYDVFQHGTYSNGGMIKRADGSYSKRGLWDNIRANAGSGKKPTKEMLAQERKINNQKANGGYLSSFKASNIQTY